MITVRGMELSINGNVYPAGLKVGEDPGEIVGFGVYRILSVQTSEAEVVWHAGPQEIIWRRAKAGEMDAGLARVVSHMDERAATCGGQAFDVSSEREAVARLNALIEQWREGPLVRVRSSDICPDWTNRAETGLSVDHVHYVATMISTEGFRSRRRGLQTEDGAHDVPVLIRESPESELGRGALDKWFASVHEMSGFPPFLLDGRQEFFCSLGNGHFSQALNLFRTGSRSIWTNKPYLVGSDDALREALEEGVDSVVLSGRMPTRDRRFVSEMLNKSHGRTWHIDAGGKVSVDEKEMDAISGSQFVALSKVLDAEELSCLVRQKLGVQLVSKL